MQAMTEAPNKLKAKDRRAMQKEHSAQVKHSQGRGEEIPMQKGYKRTKMRFF